MKQSEILVRKLSLRAKAAVRSSFLTLAFLVLDADVAVAGLPEPQEKHALIMARFAHDCSLSMTKVTKELEVTLGPDTGELSMRFGLHSGPVTAGVLRGERARFQLFGDTGEYYDLLSMSGRYPQ